MNIDKIVSSPNVCELMDDDKIKEIGLKIKQGYDDDRQSRSRWETKNADILKKALQIADTKSYPWPGASNVKFPLITIAALNWHARAYPVIVPGEQVVRCKVVGSDDDGMKQFRAMRVGQHMSYQLMEETSWEEGTDRGMLIFTILGTMFKKTYRDTARKINESQLVIPQDLVVNYWTKSLELSPRVTHRFTLTNNELFEYVQAGTYREIPLAYSQSPGQTPLEILEDKAQSMAPPPPQSDVAGPHFLCECSCWLDLDDDGYAEPYCVTFEETSGYVYRIVARFYNSDIKYNAKGEIQRILPENYFTKFEFIPSPDGGFYGVGLGHLLSPISDSVDTAINQIFDSGTMNTLGGGFLGRGVKIKGGTTTMGPNQWKSVDSSGPSLKENIVMLPTKEPSPILLQLVQFLVNYGERIGGVGDIQVGELPGQNLKAHTAEIANENGKKIFNATYKRFCRSQKEEFKKLYRLNQLYATTIASSRTGKLFSIQPEDYQDTDDGICPVADPNISSESERRQQAQMLHQLGMQQPGFDKYLVTRNMLISFNVENLDKIYPDPKGKDAIQPPPNPAMMELEIKNNKLQLEKQKLQMDGQIKAANLMAKVREVQAKILKYEAEALKITAEAQGIDKDRMLAAIQIAINAENAHRDDLIDVAKLLMDDHENNKPGGIPSMEAAPHNPVPVQPASPNQAGNAGTMG